MPKRSSTKQRLSSRSSHLVQLAKPENRRQLAEKLNGLSESDHFALHHSQYLETLLDPAGKWGAKIPDPDTSLSFVSHCKMVDQLTIGADGVGGFCVNVGWLGVLEEIPAAAELKNRKKKGKETFKLPPPNQFTKTTARSRAGAPQVASNFWSDYYTTNAFLAADTLDWANSGIKTYATQLDYGIINRVRPVSALLTVKSQASGLTNKGRIMMGFIPGPSIGPNVPLGNVAAQSLLSTTQIATIPNVVSISASKAFAECRYLPTDARTMTYGEGPGNPCFFDEYEFTGSQFGVLFAVIEGASAGDVYTIELYENLECLPARAGASFLVPTDLSRSDPLELSAVSNFLGKRPTVSVSQRETDALVGTAESSVLNEGVARQETRSETFMDKILGGAKKVIQHAPMVLSMLSKVL